MNFEGRRVLPECSESVQNAPFARCSRECIGDFPLNPGHAAIVALIPLGLRAQSSQQALDSLPTHPYEAVSSH